MSAHTAAAIGNLHVLKSFKEQDATLLTKKDGNGWRPIHEAARGGQTEALEFLIQNGANVNERTNNNQGGTPLWWAEQMLDEDDPAIKVLQKAGAVSIPPNDPD